jgi:hypothetical protein
MDLDGVWHGDGASLMMWADGTDDADVGTRPHQRGGDPTLFTVFTFVM